MKRSFRFYLNGEQKFNFKMCDLKFFLQSYDETEIVFQRTKFPQKLIVKAKDFGLDEIDVWEVSEERNNAKTSQNI